MTAEHAAENQSKVSLRRLARAFAPLIRPFVGRFSLGVMLILASTAIEILLPMILGFVAEATIVQSWLWYGVMPASVFGAVALSLLELMVAFIQAYIFTFLSALFIGMALHPH